MFSAAAHLAMLHDAQLAAEQFVRQGFEYAPLLTCQAPDKFTIDWRRSVPSSDISTLGAMNLGLRSDKMFALRVSRGMFGATLQEQPVFQLLAKCGTLLFEQGDDANFIFQRDTVYHEVTEGTNTAGPLAGTSVVASSGWLGYGLAESEGRIVRVRQSGELKHLDDVPELIELLQTTQYFRVRLYG